MHIRTYVHTCHTYMYTYIIHTCIRAFIYAHIYFKSLLSLLSQGLVLTPLNSASCVWHQLTGLQGLIGRLMRSVEARRWGGVVGGGKSNPGQTRKGWDHCDHELSDCVREYRQYDFLVDVMTENNDWAVERFSVLLVEALTTASDSTRAEPPSDTCVWQTGNACLCRR